MTDTSVETTYGEPPPPVCPRCARRVDMDAIGPQVGLCHCLSCQRYACRWCWLKARGRCPMCAAPYEVWGAAAAGTAAAAARTRHRRRKVDRRAAALFVALIAVVSIVSLSTLGWLGSVGGAESRATVRPGGIGSLGAGGSAAGLLDPTASSGASTAASGSPSAGTTGQPGATARSNPTPPGGKETATPGGAPAPTATAIATPRVTPAPTTKPTPRPTPTATAAPTPTPSPCLTVPNLVGKTVSAARTLWSATFTGAFTATPSKNGNYIVDGQNPAAGSCVPPSSAMAVTTHKP